MNGQFVRIAVDRVRVTFADIPVWKPKIVDVLPHDPAAYTQGLIYHDGALFESTGMFGQPSIR